MKIFKVIAIATMLLVGPLWAKGDKTPTPVNKEAYTQQVETKLTDWDRTVSQLKTERDSKGVATDQYKKISDAVANMEGELKDIRSELKDLRESDKANWNEYKNNIDKGFVNVETHYNRVKMAE